jgi:hypothetical protein
VPFQNCPVGQVVVPPPVQTARVGVAVQRAIREAHSGVGVAMALHWVRSGGVPVPDVTQAVPFQNCPVGQVDTDEGLQVDVAASQVLGAKQFSAVAVTQIVPFQTWPEAQLGGVPVIQAVPFQY